MRAYLACTACAFAVMALTPGAWSLLALVPIGVSSVLQWKLMNRVGRDERDRHDRQ